MAQESSFAESVAANGILIGAFWIVAQPHKVAAYKITQAKRQSQIVNEITGPTSPRGTKLLDYDDFETLVLEFGRMCAGRRPLAMARRWDETGTPKKTADNPFALRQLSVAK
jgi:hypothetical protein